MPEDPSPETDAVPELPDDLNEFARRLASFEARSLTFKSDQLMFEAGRTAARGELLLAATTSRRTLRLWQSAALMLTAVSAGMGTTMALRPEPKPLVIVHRSPSHDQVDEVPDRTINEPAPGALDPTTIPVRETSVAETSGGRVSDVMVFTPHALESIRARQSFIDQFLDSDFRSDRTVAESEAPSSFVNLTPSDPPLTPRSLMMGEKSRIWINHLIEEPKL